MNKIDIGAAKNMNVVSYVPSPTIKHEPVHVGAATKMVVHGYNIDVEISKQDLDINGYAKIQYLIDKSIEQASDLNIVYTIDSGEILTYSGSIIGYTNLADTPTIKITIKVEGHAMRTFSIGEWVWTTNYGWSQLQENTLDDRHSLMINDSTYTSDGREFGDDEHSALFTFDPLCGTSHPVIAVEEPVMQTADEWANSTLFNKYYEDSVKNLASATGTTVEMLTGSKAPFALTQPTTPDTFELEGILDAIDFNSTMRDLIADGYGNMRGGQMSDGTWFLSGSKSPVKTDESDFIVGETYTLANKFDDRIFKGKFINRLHGFSQAFSGVIQGENVKCHLPVEAFEKHDWYKI